MRSIQVGATNQTIVFHCFDSDEAAVTLAFNSAGLSLSYVVDVDGREGTPVALTPIARDVAGTHQDGAITSKGDGKHEVDLPDAAFASAGYVRLIVSATAVTGAVYSEVLAVGVTAVLDSSARVKLAAEQPDYHPATTAELEARTILAANYRQNITLRGTDITEAKAFDLLLAASAGITSQPSGTTEKFKFLDGNDAFTTTFDTNGNRTGVALA